jgi:hypothetical protein
MSVWPIGPPAAGERVKSMYKLIYSSVKVIYTRLLIQFFICRECCIHAGTQKGSTGPAGSGGNHTHHCLGLWSGSGITARTLLSLSPLKALIVFIWVLPILPLPPENKNTLKYRRRCSHLWFLKFTFCWDPTWSTCSEDSYCCYLGAHPREYE